MRRALRTLLLLGSSIALHTIALRAQGTIPIEGTVVDAETRAPIGGAVVRVTDENKRTYTSSAGRFRIPVAPGAHKVTASSIGYRDSIFTITPGSGPVTLALHASSIVMPGVEVTAGLSADQIIQRAIARKQENVEKAKTVQGLLYSKVQYEVTGNAFGRIKDEDRLAIIETFSRAYYSDRGPRLKVIQRRQTANIPSDGNLVALGNFISFYEDNITFVSTTIPSPLNPSTLSRYDFSLRERTSLGGQTVYVIDVKPATTVFPTFEGTIRIVADSYNLIDVDLRPSSSTAISFISDLRFRQKFEKFQDDIWQPTYLQVTGRGNFEIVRGIAEVHADVTATSTFTELQVNAPIPDSVYADQRIISAAPGADSARPEFWEKNALSELTPEEQGVYKRVDSLVAASDTTGERGGGGRFSLSPMISFNRVGSISAGLNVGTRLGPLDLEGMGGYSFGLRRPIGEASARIDILQGDPNLSIGGRLFSLLGTNSSDRSVPDLFNSAVAALVHRDYYDYYRKDGWGADLRFGLGALSAGLSLEMANHFSQTNTTSRSIFLHRAFRPNPPVIGGHYRTLTGTLGWGPGENAIVLSNDASASIAGGVSLQYGEEGSRGTSFRSAEGNLRLSLPTFPTGYLPMTLDMVSLAGIGSDNLPIEYQFRMRTSVSVLGRLGALYSAPVGLYGGTRYVTVAADHNFSDILWRAIGLPTYFGRGPELLISGAAGYFENGAGTGYLPTGGQWYGEVGFGVGKIPTFVGNLIYLSFDTRWGVGPLASGKWGMVIGLSTPL
jgi:hypothetical protein